MTEELCVDAGDRVDETERNGDDDDDPLPVRNALTDAEKESKEEILHVCLAVLIDEAEREGDGESEKKADDVVVNNDERENDGDIDSLEVSVLESVLVTVEKGVEDRLFVEQSEVIEVGVDVTAIDADKDCPEVLVGTNDTVISVDTVELNDDEVESEKNGVAVPLIVCVNIEVGVFGSVESGEIVADINDVKDSLGGAVMTDEGDKDTVDCNEGVEITETLLDAESDVTSVGRVETVIENVCFTDRVEMGERLAVDKSVLRGVELELPVNEGLVDEDRERRGDSDIEGEAVPEPDGRNRLGEVEEESDDVAVKLIPEDCVTEL